MSHSFILSSPLSALKFLKDKYIQVQSLCYWRRRWCCAVLQCDTWATRPWLRIRIEATPGHRRWKVRRPEEPLTSSCHCDPYTPWSAFSVQDYILFLNVVRLCPFYYCDRNRARTLILRYNLVRAGRRERGSTSHLTIADITTLTHHCTVDNRGWGHQTIPFSSAFRLWTRRLYSTL